MRALRIRRWIARGNGVLLAGLVALVLVRLVATEDAAPAPAAWEIPAEALAPPDRGSSALDWDLDELLGMMHALTGRPVAGDRVAAPTALPKAPEGPLPLAGFGLVLYLADPQGPDLVMIRSQDPAHPIRYTLHEGEVTDGISIESIEDAADALRITILRADERRVLERRKRREDVESCLRRLPAPVVSSAAPGVDAVRGGDPGLRCVPFYDEQGRAVGLRVTGLDPEGALAAAGVRAGDALLEVDGVVVREARDLVARWRAHGAPRDLVVQATSGGDPLTRRLRVP